MASTASHPGEKPSEIFVVERKGDPYYWVYMKEGHAINRMLKERKLGADAKIIRYVPEDSYDS